MTIAQFTKAASILTGTFALLGALWAFDAHYATAANVEEVQRKVETQLLDMRRQTVEDQIFVIDLKRQAKRTDDIDEAMALRLRRQLDLLNTQLRTTTSTK